MVTDSNDIETLQRQLAEVQAKLDAAQLDVAKQANVSGSGAVAQGGSDALGEGSVKVNDSNSGSINTGTQIIINYLTAASTPLTKEQIAQRVGGYLNWLRDRMMYIELRGSVLDEHEGVYRFIHLAFQEFLVARYLREVIGGEGREQILAFLRDRLDDP